MPRLSLVIPMRNERPSVDPLFRRLARAAPGFPEPYRIVVVDDGSSDATGDAVRRWADRLPVQLIRLEGASGLGGGLRAGVEASVNDSEYVVTMDGDDSHDPHLVPRLVAALEEGHDAVIASRFAPGGEERGVAGHRRLMSHAASWLLRSLFPMDGVRDYSSGYRAYRSEALREVRKRYGDLISEPGFACMVELLLRLRAVGARITEVPLVLRYDRKASVSKMEIGETIPRYVAVIRRHLRDPA